MRRLGIQQQYPQHQPPPPPYSICTIQTILTIILVHTMICMIGSKSIGSCYATVTGVNAFVTTITTAASKHTIATTGINRRRRVETCFAVASMRRDNLSPYSTFQKPNTGTSSSWFWAQQRNLSLSSSSYYYDGTSHRKKRKNAKDIIYTTTNMVNIISSPQSVTAKKVSSLLKQKKRREQLQQVVVEGPRIVFDLYRNVHTRKYISRVLMDIDLFEEYSEYFQQLHVNFPPMQDSIDENHDDNDNHDTTASSTNSDTNSEAAQPEVIQSSTTTTESPLNDVNGDKTTMTKKHRTIIFHPTDREVFKECCTDTVTNQGIVAICDIPQHLPLSSKKQMPDTNQQHRYHDMYLVCDAIQDPGNMGTLIRSAVACGVTAIYVLPNACDVWNPKAIRSAMGATFTIPIIEMNHWDDCYRELRRIGCTSSTIYAATMLDGDESDGTKKNPPPAFNVAQELKNITKYTSDSHNSSSMSSSSSNSTNTSPPSVTKSTAHYDVDWIGASLLRPNEELHSDVSTTVDTTPKAQDETGTIIRRKKKRIPTASALIIGSEGNGLTENIRTAIEKARIRTVYVPMMNMATSPLDPNTKHVTPIVESLNAAICGSIILFEYLRQKNTAPAVLQTSSTKNNNNNNNNSSNVES